MADPKNNEKTPADKAIAAFGGVESLAKTAGCSVWRIYRLRKAGAIPANLQGAILAAARERGLPLTAEDLIDMRTPHVRAAEDVQ